MNTLDFIQLSPEWWDYKVAKVGGRRFGQVISGRKNRLKYELLDEKIKGYIEQDEYESEEMTFGKDQEPIARAEIIRTTGIEFGECGVIVSDFNPKIHMHSPDGLNHKHGIVLEIKSTSDGSIHIQRFFEGPESAHIPQIINPFVCSDDVKEVWWYSWNPFVQIRPLVKHVYNLDSILEPATAKKQAYTIRDAVTEGRELIASLESDLIDLENRFIF
jgi:hypothetical protein